MECVWNCQVKAIRYGVDYVPVSEMQLPPHVVNALKANGINNIGDLRGMSEDYLRRFIYIGKTRAKQIKEALSAWDASNTIVR